MEAQGSSLEVRLVCSKPSTLKKKIILPLRLINEIFDLPVSKHI